MTLDEKLAKVLPFKSKLPGQFQCFNAIDRSIEIFFLTSIRKIFLVVLRKYIFYNVEC